MEQWKSLTAREELQKFLNEVKHPDGIMCKYSLNQMEFAVKHATDEAIEQFIEWLFDGEETPNPDNLNDLNNGNYDYAENFETIKLDYPNYHIDIPVSADNVDQESGQVNEWEIDVQDYIYSAIDEFKPLGYDSNSSLTYHSQGVWYATTDFGENGEHDANPIIASFDITFKIIE